MGPRLDEHASGISLVTLAEILGAYHCLAVSIMYSKNPSPWVYRLLFVKDYGMHSTVLRAADLSLV
jgi:hypothetical protein